MTMVERGSVADPVKRADLHSGEHSHIGSTESRMTFPVSTQPARSGPNPAVAAVVGVATIVAVFTLIMAGITFIGLAIAFPIAVPVAEAYHVPVRAADAALAAQFAGYWWAFGVLAVASFVGAALAALGAAKLLTPRD
jgi:hypothetical protein